MLGAAKASGGGWGARLSAALGLFFVPRRVHGEATVHDRLRAERAGDESTVNVSREAVTQRVHGDDGAPGRGRPGRVRGPDAGVQGSEETVAATGQDDDDAWKPLIFMGVKDTVDEFVFYMLSEGDPPYRLTHSDWVDQFRRWALSHRVQGLPPSIFLAAFGRHPAVKKGRDRLKKGDGSVIRLDTEARSPRRKVVYVLAMPRKLPGTVPVAGVVPPRPVASKSKRAAEKAVASPAPPEPMPQRRAA